MKNIPSKQVEAAWVLLIRAQQVLLNRAENALKEAGFPPLSWYDILLELSRNPDAGLRQYEIGELVLLNKHNLSRLIDRLEGEGLVKRQGCEGDGRGNIVKLTTKGGKLKQQMWPVYAQSICELIDEPLTDIQVQGFTEILQVLIERALTKA